ncbi:unnamed protein product [Linum trigynum]|uniref:Uncharacterized protein n=1 Tax=Linum trigynum TaxID=586398 RepID=A0AAV2F6Q6_9ROSI
MRSKSRFSTDTTTPEFFLKIIWPPCWKRTWINQGKVQVDFQLITSSNNIGNNFTMVVSKYENQKMRLLDGEAAVEEYHLGAVTIGDWR